MCAPSLEIGVARLQMRIGGEDDSVMKLWISKKKNLPSTTHARIDYRGALHTNSRGLLGRDSERLCYPGVLIRSWPRIDPRITPAGRLCVRTTQSHAS